jgi:predicted RNA-binding Zn ribbon-like protein
MSQVTQARPPYDLCGGHPALDFVNSLDNRFHADGPRELLADYADLLRFTRQTRLLDAGQLRRLADAVDARAAARALRSARELREALAAAFYGGVDQRPPPPAALKTLERYFHGMSAHQQLRWDRSGPTWDWGDAAAHAELPVWMLAHAASQLMFSEALNRIRACGAESCRWLFLDTSKNHTRRWCKMQVCGNRMKARRFQARSAHSQAPQ